MFLKNAKLFKTYCLIFYTKLKLKKKLHEILFIANFAYFLSHLFAQNYSHRKSNLKNKFTH